MALLSLNYDFVISAFEYYTSTSLDKLFVPKKPFEWDSSHFVSPERFNNNLNLPTLWDPTTGGVPVESFQSGHGFDDNIELEEIDLKQTLDKQKWTPRLNHGTYFARQIPFYLYSDESITDFLGEESYEDRSRINLKFRPKPGIPISAQVLILDNDFNVTIDSNFLSVARFTGNVQNGVELDTSQGLNIDTDRKEFILHTNPNNVVKNFKVPTPLTGPGIVSFFLPKVPLSYYPVIFNRQDIFQRKRFIAVPYGDQNYNTFYYGTGLDQIGDYMVNFTTGEVTVWLDQTYVDLGYVTFTWDYPAWLEFNDNYVVDYGSTITSPVAEDIPSLIRGPQSDGSTNQIVSIDRFPIIDYTTERYLDEDSFKLFTYNSFSQVFDNTWERVRSLEDSSPTDKHYVLDSETGTVFFGDGITSAIPTIFHFFFFGVKSSVRVQYEPDDAGNFWTDRSQDNHPLHNTLNSGFLYLSRKELIPASVVIHFPVEEITSLESCPLTITVLDREFEPIPNAEVQLTIDGDVGTLEDTLVITDAAGEALTNYIPSSRIEDLGALTFFFETSLDPDQPGDPVESSPFSTRTLPNDTLTLNDSISSAPEDIIVFKIYANEDPFNVFDHTSNEGGHYLVHYKDDGGQNVLVRPIAVLDTVLVFDESLPQPYNALDPNYEPNLRGYVIITSKEIRVQGSLQYRNREIFSNIEKLIVGYSLVQKGEWTLPILPTIFTGSEIDRATWITINP